MLLLHTFEKFYNLGDKTIETDFSDVGLNHPGHPSPTPGLIGLIPLVIWSVRPKMAESRLDEKRAAATLLIVYFF